MGLGLFTYTTVDDVDDTHSNAVKADIKNHISDPLQPAIGKKVPIPSKNSIFTTAHCSPSQNNDRTPTNTK